MYVIRKKFASETKMPDKDRLDYKIACMSNDGPPKDHPYLDKVRKEQAIDPVKINAPVTEEKVDKGFRKILFVGFDRDLAYLLAKAYEGKDVQRFELVFVNSTDDAKKQMNAGSRFDYVLTPAFRSISGRKFIVKGKYGRKTEEVPIVDINGYDIAFASSHKGLATIIYDTNTDASRAKQVGAVTALSPQNLEAEIRRYEDLCRNSFLVTRQEKLRLLKDFLKKRRMPGDANSNELTYILD